jgi:hypothetical protein
LTVLADYFDAVSLVSINNCPLPLLPLKTSIPTSISTSINPAPRATHHTPMASVQKVAVVLDGSNAWHDWLEVVKTKARAGTVWEIHIFESLTGFRPTH